MREKVATRLRQAGLGLHGDVKGKRHCERTGPHLAFSTSFVQHNLLASAWNMVQGTIQQNAQKDLSCL